MSKTAVMETPLEQKLRAQGKKLKIKQQLTKPIYSMAHLESLDFMALGEPREADFAVEVPGKKDSKPTIIDVMNIGAGEEGFLILNTVILGSLQRAGGPLSGRLFRIESLPQREGKKYKDFKVYELELDN